MNLHQKLRTALDLCGYTPPSGDLVYKKLGNGAWHNAYLVNLTPPSLVVRLRKDIIYGRQAVFNRKTLHEDYAPVGLYYQQANVCHLGICPQIYHYHLQPNLTFTIETYLGETLKLANLDLATAFDYGYYVIFVFLCKQHYIH